MRLFALTALVGVALAGPALAQAMPDKDMKAHMGEMKPKMKPRPMMRRSMERHETPLDRGPYTPEANRAYEGGGVVLQGAPGAPPPRPEGTPQGQRPRGMVPPGM